MFDCEIKSSKEGCLSCLSSIQLLHFYKTFKIVVVSEHLHRMRSTIEVVSPMLESLYDRQQLLIVCFIITFRWN